MTNIQQSWYQVKIKVKAGFEEAIEFALNELDSLGNEIDILGKKADEDISVIGYFNDLPNDKLIQNNIDKALEIYNFPNDSVKGFSTKKVENQDWLAEWKKHWKPTEVGKFIIAPPWENVENTDKIVIKIEPNMAFGTGTHETTKLCLKAIEENYKSGMSFFDVGTGTGILSIAVSKLQPDNSKIIGCDTDEDSVKIAKENAELNNAGEIKFYVGSIENKSPNFDFVCANVTADIIIPMLPLLLQKADKILVLSGILVEQKDLILSELKKLNIENPAIQTDGEWISTTIKF